MRRKVYRLRSTVYGLLLITCFLLLPRPALAQTTQTWGSRCQIGSVATLQGFECLFTNILRILVPIAGIALFIMLIAGSFQMLTAGGEPKAIEKARKTITSAIFGLVIFFGIWFVLKLIQTITGVDVTKFQIPGP